MKPAPDPTREQAEPVEVVTLPFDGPAGRLEARLYGRVGPARALVDTLLVFFHAGGFRSGSLDASDACMRELAARVDAFVFAPAYSQTADQPFPAAAEDAYAAITECAARPRRYRWSGRHLVVGGTEAGGNLAAVASLMARDRGGPKLAGQLLMVPMLDPGLTSPSMRSTDAQSGAGIALRCAEGYRTYLPRPGDRVHPYACPLASSRLKGLPPTLMISIDGDPLRDEAEAYVAKLAAAGVAVRTHVMRVPVEAGCLVDASERCRASSDDDAFRAIAEFLASVARPAS